MIAFGTPLKFLSAICGKNISPNTCRFFSKNSQLKVTLCGASGNVGQPLSLMLKQSPHIDELALYDILDTSGLSLELSHVDTKCKVQSYTSPDIENALKGSNIVVVVGASSPSASYSDFEKMFYHNAGVIREIMLSAAENCPKALFAIATNPVDGLVPLASEILKSKNVYNNKSVFGITSLNIVRTNTFVAEMLGIEPECVCVPVIGGNVNESIIPLLSQAKPYNDFNEEEIEMITKSVQCAHCHIIKLKSSEGATLSAAFSIARFVISLVKGLKGYDDIYECAFIRTNAHPKTKYLALPFKIGPAGVQKDVCLPVMSSYEQCLLEKALPIINKYVDKAKKYLGIEEKTCDRCDPDPKSPRCPEDWCEKKAKGTLNDL